MGEKTFDVNNPDDIARAIDAAFVQVFGTVKEKASLILSRREACHERGFHRVSSDEPLEEEGSFRNARLCYDCEAVVFKGDFPYKVVPL